MPPPGETGEVGARSSGGPTPDFFPSSLATVASKTFSHTTVFSAPIDRAWKALQDASTWGSIGGVDHVHDAHHGPDGALLSYAFAATVGGSRYPGSARVVGSTPPDQMVVDIDTSELAGSITVRLRPTGHSGVITVELAVRSKSLLSGMMFPLIASAIGTGLGGNVEAFAARLSTE